MTALTIKNYLESKVPQIRLAVVRENDPVEPIAVLSPADLEHFLEPMKHHSEEYFVALHLNTRYEITGFHEVSHGTLDSSLVHPREVFKAAFVGNSYAIIVAHNHPGGSLKPSREDLEITKKLVKAGRLLGVQVVDHVIVAHTGTVSLREKHAEAFNDVVE